RNREKADQFRADNQLDAKQDALVGLDARLTELNRELGAARDRGGEQVEPGDRGQGGGEAP
ncbi:hypothetical protein J7S33_12665, partial [Saccharothrix algeriensis]